MQASLIQEIGALLEPLRTECVAAEQPNKNSIFARLGGQEAINLAVEKFYEKVLNDNRVKHFFAKTNMKDQRQKQKDFLTTALGGPNV